MDLSGRAVEHGLQKQSQNPPSSNIQNQSEEDRSTPIGAEDTASTATAPSSPRPLDRGLLSSDAAHSESELSSPPSSPPRLPSPILETRKPTFSFLKRKRHDEDDPVNGPLCNITPNVQKKIRPLKTKNLTQMQIDLGGETRKKCRSCGMEYIPSVREDADMHKDFCGMNLGGIEVGKGFVKDETVHKIGLERNLISERESIILVDRRSSVSARNKIQKILSVVNAELGSAEMDESELWSDTSGEVTGSKAESKRKGFYGQEKKYDQFKAFLHVVDGRCVGFCLAQKISHAFSVVTDKPTESQHPKIAISPSSSISFSPAEQVVLLGISRIWTSKSHRGRGLGFNLLECARTNFFYGVQVPRHLVAFSQPTESGAKLARRWFETDFGWHVYQSK